MEGNTALHNGPYSGIGLFEAVDADHHRQVSGPTTRNTIRGNTVKANNACRTPQGPCDNDGIRVEPGVDFTTIADNIVQESGLDGIAVFRTANDNTVVGNTVEHNGHHRAAHRKGSGIKVFSDRNLVENNASFHNAADGISLGFVTPRGVLRPALAEPHPDQPDGQEPGVRPARLPSHVRRQRLAGQHLRDGRPALHHRPVAVRRRVVR